MSINELTKQEVEMFRNNTNYIAVFFALTILVGCGPLGGNGPGDGRANVEICEPVERTQDCTFKEDVYQKFYEASALQPICQTECWRTDKVRIEVIDELQTVKPLRGFREVGGLRIANNPNLRRLSGLSRLKKANELDLGANESLETLAGLDSLETLVTGLSLSGTRLKSLDGIESLRDPGATIQLSKNTELESLEALKNIERESISAIRLRRNHALTDLKGLEWVRELGQISLVNNNGLESLDALHGLKSVEGVRISDNSSLTRCEIDEFLDSLETSPDLVSVKNNKTDTCNE